MALHIGVLWVVFALVGSSILYFASEPRAVKAFLYAFLVGDIAHLAVTYIGLGHENFIDYGNWSSSICGEVVVAVYEKPNSQNRGALPLIVGRVGSICSDGSFCSVDLGQSKHPLFKRRRNSASGQAASSSDGQSGGIMSSHSGRGTKLLLSILKMLSFQQTPHVN